jgi:hypothetical protein
MKRVIKEVEKNVVSISDIDNSSIVGIDWGTSKSMVIQEDYNVFTSLGNNCRPNLLNVWERRTQFEYVESAMAQGGYVKVYVFDNIKELFNWMSK